MNVNPFCSPDNKVNMPLFVVDRVESEQAPRMCVKQLIIILYFLSPCRNVTLCAFLCLVDVSVVVRLCCQYGNINFQCVMLQLVVFVLILQTKFVFSHSCLDYYGSDLFTPIWLICSLKCKWCEVYSLEMNCLIIY